MKEALIYEKLEDNKVRCNLCNHRCVITDSKRGICGVRENRAGALYTLVYGKAVASHVDPIEKKPFFNFYPGSTAYSVATVGCNLCCLHCQNYDISQGPREGGEIVGEKLEPEEIVRQALSYGCKSISYTYTEPTIFFEYALDTMKLARNAGLKNNFVTNGYMTPQALEMLKPYLDAANVDLKGFNEEHYKKVCGAKLKPVLENIKLMKRLGIWVEVTTLVIPGLNDSDEILKKIADFVLNLGKETPWHISAFYPTYKMLDQPRTPVATLQRGREIGLKAGLRYVYSGNVPGEEGENTFCYACEKLLISRFGFQVVKNEIKNSRCPYCNAEIDGRGM